jgi:hypothetical protein
MPILYDEGGEMVPDYDDYPSMQEMGSGGWIKNAVNPAHKGYCTPMTKSTCTPRRKAFARRAKAHFKEDGGELEPVYEMGKTYDLATEKIAELAAQGYEMQII